MDLQAYVDEIKMELTGGVVDLDITDEALVRVINSALREVQRYIDTTRLITIDYSNCMDLTEYKVSSVSRVFRSSGYLTTGDTTEATSSTGYYYVDPIYASMWASLYGYGCNYGLSDWVYNISSYNTSLQIANTLSTDLVFRFDKPTNKLYVNCPYNKPSTITIEYVPVYQDVSEITSDFWIDILKRLALALTKVTIGRVRKKFTQSNALWQLDTDILSEGTEELNTLREQMRNASQLTYGID